MSAVSGIVKSYFFFFLTFLAKIGIVYHSSHAEFLQHLSSMGSSFQYKKTYTQKTCVCLCKYTQAHN